MAKPGIIYRINWQSFHESTDVQCYVDISDTDNLIPDGDTATVIPLIGSNVSMSVIDNDDNPFKPIRGQQLTIQFNSTSNYSMATFSSGSDQRWKVDYYVTDSAKVIFTGFLVLDDLSEPLLPATEVVTLTATDNLGLLKDIPLTNSDGSIPRGKYRIIDILSKCLAKTGLSLDFRIAFNIKLGANVTDISTTGATAEHFFDTEYLDIKTFEDEIGTLLNCYEIITRILGHEACLFQMKGQWWIMRIDEVEDLNRGLYVTSFNGTTFTKLGQIHFDKVINKSASIKFSNEATRVRIVRPKKSVRLNYNFSPPSETPTNSSFKYGDFISASGSTKKYEIDSWTVRQGIGSASAAANCLAYIERKFSANGQEEERYAVVTWPTAPSALNYIECEGIPVAIKDKFSFSVDFAWFNNPSGGSYDQDVMTIRLEGDDNTYWTLGEDSKWYQSTSTWSTNFQLIKQSWTFGDIDETQYRTRSIDAEPCPTSGNVVIMLYALNQQGTTSADNSDIKFANISFDYIPFINGSYQNFDGQYHITTQTGNYKAKIEDEVYISDSPRKQYKGALLQVDHYDTVYSGTVGFLAGNSFSLSGVWDYYFKKGDILKITGSVNNNQTTRVVKTIYHIITSSTEIVVEGTTVFESHTALIERPFFVLSNQFYNAAVFPSGPPNSDYIHTYGEIQLFDVWNQYKNEMRLLEYTCQGIDLDLLDADSLPDTAHLINKYSGTDGSHHLDNKFFIKLSFNQNQDNAEDSGVMREVFDTTKSKDYSNHDFKFIERG